MTLHALKRLEFIKNYYQIASSMVRLFIPGFLAMAIGTTVSSAQIVTDPATLGYQPSVGDNNGVPTVNIVAPQVGGVSHNKYDQLNVGAEGVIYNNACLGSSTILAGSIGGNSNLCASGPAGVILNEVTGNSNSLLEGASEVAGTKADVIYANSNGVTCNGCGFINTGTATLTTGTPSVSVSGDVSLTTSTGKVSVMRGGLDGDGATDGVNLVGKQVYVDGRVETSGDLLIVGGSSSVDLATEMVVGTGTQAGYAVDATVYGAYEAEKITIIGTDSGLGVRQLGGIKVMNGNAELRSEGDLTVRSISANVNVTSLAAGETADVLLSAGSTLNLIGDVFAQNQIVVNGADVVVNDGVEMESMAGISFSALNSITSGAQIESFGDITFTAADIIISAGVIETSKTLDINASDTAKISDATLISKITDVNAGTSIDLDDAIVIASESATFSADSIGFTDEVAFNINNNAALPVLNTKTFNVASTIDWDTLTINGLQVLNIAQAGTVIGDALTLNIPVSIDNKGLLYSNGNLTIATGVFTNDTTGQITAVSSGVGQPLISIAASTLLTNDGTIMSPDELRVVATALSGNGNLFADGLLNLSGGDLTAGSTAVWFGDVVAIDAIGTVNVKGTVSSNKGLSLSTGVQSIVSGTVAAHDVSVIKGGLDVSGTGSVVADDTLSITTTSAVNNDGELYALNLLKIAAASYSGTGTSSSASVDIDITSDLVVGAGGQIVADTLGFDITGNANVLGTLLSKQVTSTQLTVGGNLSTGSDGQILGTNAALLFDVGGAFNNAGVVVGSYFIDVQSGSLINSGVLYSSDLFVRTTGQITNSGMLIAEDEAIIRAGALNADIHDVGTSLSGVAGQLAILQNNGLIQGNTVELAGSNIINQGTNAKIFSNDGLGLTLGNASLFDFRSLEGWDGSQIDAGYVAGGADLRLAGLAGNFLVSSTWTAAYDVDISAAGNFSVGNGATMLVAEQLNMNVAGTLSLLGKGQLATYADLNLTAGLTNVGLGTLYVSGDAMLNGAVSVGSTVNFSSSSSSGLSCSKYTFFGTCETGVNYQQTTQSVSVVDQGRLLTGGDFEIHGTLTNDLGNIQIGGVYDQKSGVTNNLGRTGTSTRREDRFNCGLLCFLRTPVWITVYSVANHDGGQILANGGSVNLGTTQAGSTFNGNSGVIPGNVIGLGFDNDGNGVVADAPTTNVSVSLAPAAPVIDSTVEVTPGTPPTVDASFELTPEVDPAPVVDLAPPIWEDHYVKPIWYEGLPVAIFNPERPAPVFPVTDLRDFDPAVLPIAEVFEDDFFAEDTEVTLDTSILISELITPNDDENAGVPDPAIFLNQRIAIGRPIVGRLPSPISLPSSVIGRVPSLPTPVIGITKVVQDLGGGFVTSNPGSFPLSDGDVVIDLRHIGKPTDPGSPVEGWPRRIGKPVLPISSINILPAAEPESPFSELANKLKETLDEHDFGGVTGGGTSRRPIIERPEIVIPSPGTITNEPDEDAVFTVKVSDESVNGGTITAQNLDIVGSQLVNNGGTITADGDLYIDLTGDLISNAYKGGTEYVEGVIQAGGSLTADVRGDISLTGTHLGANEDVVLAAGGDVEILAIAEERTIYHDTSCVLFFCNENRQETVDTAGASVSSLGGSVTIVAGYRDPDGENNVTIGGASIYGAEDVSIKATADVLLETIAASADQIESDGVDCGLFCFGNQTTAWNEIVQQNPNIMGNNINIEAGGSVTGVGAELTAFSNLDITAAEEIEFSAYIADYYYENDGWTFGVSFPGSDLINAVADGDLEGALNNMIASHPLGAAYLGLQDADSPLDFAKAIGGAASFGAGLTDAEQCAQLMDFSGGGAKNADGSVTGAQNQGSCGQGGAGGAFADSLNPFAGFGSEFTFSFDSWSQAQAWQQGTQSTLTAANASFSSGGDMNFLDSVNIDVTGNLLLDSGGAVNFTAMMLESESENSSLGLSLGVSVGPGGVVPTSFGFNASDGSSESSTAVQGSVNVGGTLILMAEDDSTIEGTLIVAGDAVVDVDGDLSITSAQSTSSNESSNAGGNVGISGGGIGNLGVNTGGGQGSSAITSALAGIQTTGELSVTAEDLALVAGILFSETGELNATYENLSIAELFDYEFQDDWGFNLNLNPGALESMLTGGDMSDRTAVPLEFGGSSTGKDYQALNYSVLSDGTIAVVDPDTGEVIAEGSVEEMVAAIGDEYRKSLAERTDIWVDEVWDDSWEFGIVDVAKIGSDLEKSMDLWESFAPAPPEVKAQGPAAEQMYKLMLLSGVDPAEALARMDDPQTQEILERRQKYIDFVDQYGAEAAMGSGVQAALAMGLDAVVDENGEVWVAFQAECEGSGRCDPEKIQSMSDFLSRNYGKLIEKFGGDIEKLLASLQGDQDAINDTLENWEEGEVGNRVSESEIDSLGNLLELEALGQAYGALLDCVNWYSERAHALGSGYTMLTYENVEFLGNEALGAVTAMTTLLTLFDSPEQAFSFSTYTSSLLDAAQAGNISAIVEIGSKTGGSVADIYNDRTSPLAQLMDFADNTWDVDRSNPNYGLHTAMVAFGQDMLVSASQDGYLAELYSDVSDSDRDELVSMALSQGHSVNGNETMGELALIVYGDGVIGPEMDAYLQAIVNAETFSPKTVGEMRQEDLDNFTRDLAVHGAIFVAELGCTAVTAGVAVAGCIAAGMAISYSYTAAMYGFDQANSDLLFSAGLVGTAALAGVVVRVVRSADGAIQYFDDAGRPLDQGIVDMLKSQNKLALDPDNPDQLIIPSQKPINDSAIDRVDDALRTGGGSGTDKGVDDAIPPAKRDTGETVLGQYPEYVDLSDASNARRFQIPDEQWDRMSDAQRWEANKKFLDRTIDRGDEVTLATNVNDARPGSYYEQEINYMQSRGYTVSDDGMSLLPPE